MGGGCANYVHDSVRAEGKEEASKQASSAFLSAVALGLCLFQKKKEDGTAIKGCLSYSAKAI